MASSGFFSIMSLYLVSFRPPTQPEWVRYIFCSSLLPESVALEALMTITLSPQSAWGV